MTKIPLGKSDYFRSVPREARVRLKNRFFENNPVLADFTGSLISRPATRYFLTLESSPIRHIYSSPGSFEDSAWVIGGLRLYRVRVGGDVVDIGQTTAAPSNVPTSAATGWIGDGPDAIPEFLFITDSGNLWVYCEEWFSTSTLLFSDNAADNDTVTIADVVYKFTTGDVNTGTPDGTVAFPWLVELGTTKEISIANLFKAINGTGAEDLIYSNALVPHPTVTASTYTSTHLVVRARAPGADGDALAVSTSGADLSWSSTTLLGDFARGTLTLSANATAGDVVRLGSVYYQFTSGSVDAGTPAGNVGNPWLVKIGATAEDSITNLFNAIGATGVAGTDYSTALVVNPDAVGADKTATTLEVRALAGGEDGNSVVTTETGAAMSWEAATLEGGGAPQLTQISLPIDGVGALCVVYISSYIIVIPIQNNQINGRFYWINPGETVIDPLDFATAERSPDAINTSVVFSDKVWFMGDATTEPWSPTGDPDAPFQRFQGVLFDRGCLELTALQVKDSLIIVDSDGGVFQISGGIKRISTPQIEERIRLSILAEAN